MQALDQRTCRAKRIGFPAGLRRVFLPGRRRQLLTENHRDQILFFGDGRGIPVDELRVAQHLRVPDQLRQRGVDRRHRRLGNRRIGALLQSVGLKRIFIEAQKCITGGMAAHRHQAGNLRHRQQRRSQLPRDQAARHHTGRRRQELLAKLRPPVQIAFAPLHRLPVHLKTDRVGRLELVLRQSCPHGLQRLLAAKRFRNDGKHRLVLRAAVQRGEEKGVLRRHIFVLDRIVHHVQRDARLFNQGIAKARAVGRSAHVGRHDGRRVLAAQLHAEKRPLLRQEQVALRPLGLEAGARRELMRQRVFVQFRQHPAASFPGFKTSGES